MTQDELKQLGAQAFAHFVAEWCGVEAQVS